MNNPKLPINEDAYEIAKQIADGRIAEVAAMQRVVAWDRAMTRAFRGIVSRPVRHRQLKIATGRLDGLDA